MGSSLDRADFIANISHELRTPLQAIIGFSELGISRSGPPERAAGMFANIYQSGERMLALVNDLLDVFKIDSAIGAIHLERTDLRTLVRVVIAELAPLLQRRQLGVDLQLPEHALVARVDPLALRAGGAQPAGQRHQVLASPVHHHGARAPRDG